jgi:hypothetical protein
MSIIRVNKVTYIILMKIKKKCIFILLISDVEFFFNILLERAQQRRDPNYKHTVTASLTYWK